MRNKKLSSASQRTLNRKRSQQHLDSQLRNDGDETEEDMLLNKDKNSRNVMNSQRNDGNNSGLIRNKPNLSNMEGNEMSSNHSPNDTAQTKNRKSKKNNKLHKLVNDIEMNAPNERVPISICQDHDGNSGGLQECVKRGGNDCQNQLSQNLFQDVSNGEMIDLNNRTKEKSQFQQIPNEKNVSFSEDTNQFVGNSDSENKRMQKQKEKDNSLTSNSFNIQQPDIVSWLPLLSKTSAMQCHDKDENDIKPFRSNVEIPFASSNLRNNVVKKNSFNSDDIASPKLAARHAMMLERNALKQDAISHRKRTPSLCFDVTASENSDNECQNNPSLLL